jgi:hypothetical protein
VTSGDAKIAATAGGAESRGKGAATMSDRAALLVAALGLLQLRHDPPEVALLR